MKNILQNRLQKLHSQLKDGESFLVSNPSNISYFTKVYNISRTHREAFILVSRPSSTALISPLRIDQFSKLNHLDIKTLSQDNLRYEFQKLTAANTIYIEADNISVTELDNIQKQTKANIIKSTGIIQKIRTIKDKEELNYIKIACQISASTWNQVCKTISPGKTEAQIADQIISIQKSLGADGIPEGFAPIVASGPNSAIPHHTTSNKIIKKNDVVLVDFGCKYNGYASDMTRTIKLGSQSSKFKLVETAVLKAYTLAVKTLQTTKNPKKTDQAAINVLTKYGYKKNILHTTGHGLGLDIHEPPTISTQSTESKILPQTVITIEPGVYFSNEFGYRHENTIVLTKSSPQVLTKTN